MSEVKEAGFFFFETKEAGSFKQGKMSAQDQIAGLCRDLTKTSSNIYTAHRSTNCNLLSKQKRR